jgi:uncharacterized protein (DUF488 family)
MKLYTIGFTQKNAETFFGLLRQNHIARLVDIRLNPDGQLSGFTRRKDLPFFLSRLADGCGYERILDLAPTKEVLDAYRATGDWTRYAQQFEALLDERNVPAILDREAFERFPSCLLCSEPTPKQCHRRLVAERLATYWLDVEIIHL